jgi:hypothetical protein
MISLFYNINNREQLSVILLFVLTLTLPMSSSRESSKSKETSLENLVNSARPFHEPKAVQGSAQLVGILRKSHEQDSLTLILAGGAGIEAANERIATVKLADVVKHEVLQETQDGDKLVRLYVRPDAEVSMMEKSAAAAIATNASSKVLIEKVPWNDPKMPWRDVPTIPWYDQPKLPWEGTGPDDTLQEQILTIAEQGGGTLAEQGGGTLAEQGGGTLAEQGGGTLAEQGGGTLAEQGGGIDLGQLINPGQIAVNPQITARQEAPFVMATPHMAPQWKAIESQAFGPAAGFGLQVNTGVWRDIYTTISSYDFQNTGIADTLQENIGTGIADTLQEQILTIAEQGGGTLAEQGGGTLAEQGGGTLAEGVIDPSQILTNPQLWNQFRMGFRG